MVSSVLLQSRLVTGCLVCNCHPWIAFYHDIEDSSSIGFLLSVSHGGAFPLAASSKGAWELIFGDIVYLKVYLFYLTFIQGFG